MDRKYVVHVSEEAKREYEKNERLNPKPRIRYCPECDFNMNMTATVSDKKDKVGSDNQSKEKEGGK